MQTLRTKYNFVFADLGYNMEQVAGEEYGMSYSKNAKLDMRYNPLEGLPCSEILKQLSAFELSDILSGNIHYYY